MTPIATDTTCAQACWYAREPECRCSCAGRSHGVLLLGGPQPIRNQRMAGFRYELDSIVIGYGAASRDVRERFGVMRLAEKGGAVRVQAAPAKAFGAWPELAGFEPSVLFQQHPYLIWRRVEQKG